ncbi:Holliday junction branch migration protein RuvA [Psittacicella hinzii]|uniref:Holliday junction branch migration complex subunit RuvA n=1 Tax=Psittacicella hinzii TaxID=2028575 RepID=A0A3A1Y8G4_9GAMM|nr:Holliday junction branch migration protein RuvA [Psittacicella hinzii]RIY33520.1 Holliday junction branch migration protein RuvA [Psittacicella hinzii]
MYGSLHGILLDKSTNTILIDCHGVGYEVTVPLTTFQRLPQVGNKVFLFVYHKVGEDFQQLYGFAHAIEKKLFEELIKLNKIGPRIGLAVLGMYDFSYLLNIIKQKDVKALQAVPGIGKTTAERMLLELNNRMETLKELVSLGKQQMQMLQQAYKKLEIAPETDDEPLTKVIVPEFNEHEEDDDQDVISYSAMQALVSLGLKEDQAQQLIKKVYTPEMTVEKLIKACLDFYKGK